jgi:uncharacterized ion transporter superfamily protein YfcC
MTEIQEAPPDSVEEPKERRPLRFPTAFTVLAAVLLVVWGLSFVIPSGTYDVDPDTGGPIPGTYTEIDIDKSLPHQFYKLWNAPTTGSTGSRTRPATSASTTAASSTARRRSSCSCSRSARSSA